MHSLEYKIHEFWQKVVGVAIEVVMGGITVLCAGMEMIKGGKK